MKNQYFIFMLIALLLFTVPLNATILDQKNLNEISYGDIVVDKTNTVCKTYSFNLNGIDEKSRAFAQFNIKNYILAKSGLEIKVNFNGVEVSTLKNEKIILNNVVSLPDAKEKGNVLEVCIENNFLPRFIIDTENSTVGNYYVGEIKKEDFYEKAPPKAYVNTMIPISVHIKNSGYDDLYVEVVNASDLFLYNSSLESVSGDTSFKGIITAQNEIVLNYFVKAEKGIEFATPLARLNYTDRFGQQHDMHLNTQIISLEEQETKITTYVDIFRMIEPNKKYTGHLIIKNESENLLKNIYIKPTFNGEIILSKEKINLLNPKDVIEIPFTIKTFKEGDYALGFNIDYVDGTVEKSAVSIQKTILAENIDNNENTAITILLIITVFLFIWIVKI